MQKMREGERLNTDAVVSSLIPIPRKKGDFKEFVCISCTCAAEVSVVGADLLSKGFEINSVSESHTEFFRDFSIFTSRHVKACKEKKKKTIKEVVNYGNKE